MIVFYFLFPPRLFESNQLPVRAFPRMRIPLRGKLVTRSIQFKLSVREQSARNFTRYATRSSRVLLKCANNKPLIANSSSYRSKNWKKLDEFWRISPAINESSLSFHSWQSSLNVRIYSTIEEYATRIPRSFLIFPEFNPFALLPLLPRQRCESGHVYASRFKLLWQFIEEKNWR